MIGEVEQPILDNRPANGGAETVLIESGIIADALIGIGLIDGVQVAVLEVLVDAAVESVASRDNYGVELAA